MRLLLTKSQLEKLIELVDKEIQVCRAIIKQNRSQEIKEKFCREEDELIPILRILKDE